MDYMHAYYKLFNCITDVMEELKQAQAEAEGIAVDKPPGNPDDQNLRLEPDRDGTKIISLHHVCRQT